MTDPIRAALDQLLSAGELAQDCINPLDWWWKMDAAIKAARAALAEPLPPKVGHIQRLADIIEECQPKTPYVIAATALAQAILSHPDIGLVLGNSDGPAVLEGREPAFVAGEPSDEEFRQLYCDIFDLRCDPASLGPVPVKFARAVLARWGHQPARLRNCPTHGQQPPEAWGCPECVRELREELAAALTAKQTPPAEGELSLKELDHRPKLSADDIPPGPFSEHELREQWNQQADEFNQWDSLDSCEQLAWAQARAIQRDRNAKPTSPAVTISALLRPAYEPGDGSADCAQLVNGQWWHPCFGCDSLEIVLNKCWGRWPANSTTIRDWIQGDDRRLLETFYEAELSEGGSADEVILRGIKAVLAAAANDRLISSKSAVAQPMPAPKPVAWCRSDDFNDAAAKRQSFSGWREKWSDCDIALYAYPINIKEELDS